MTTDRQRLWEAAQAALGPASTHVEFLAAQAAARGHGAWLVGGGVRDLLLGLPVQDVDLCFDTDVLQWLPELSDQPGELRSHAAFHTATWLTRGLHIDLISTRAESYPQPASLPVVRLSGLDDDLRRRDFTLNALALALVPGQRGQLVDPTGGARDLEDRVLRILHPGSFIDDPTRALRGARYAARLDLRLSPDTAEALRRALPTFQRIGLERLGTELHRVLQEPRAERALELLDQWGVLDAIHPELSGVAVKVGEGTQRVGTLGLQAHLPTSLWLSLAAHLSPPARSCLRGLVRPFRRLPGLWEHPAVDAAPLGAGRAQWGLACARIPPELWHLQQPEAVDWWVSEGRLISSLPAKRLMEAGVPRGPELGAALRAAQACAWEGGSEAEQLAAALGTLGAQVSGIRSQ